MAGTRTSYHHGDLREALLSACLQLIDTEGLAAVSLRRVAREAGVSPAAPYHHFADRAALLAALTSRGFELLTADLTAARADAPDPRAALTVMGETYLRFAQRHPSYFRLMFRPELTRSDKELPHDPIGDQAFVVLADVVAEGIRAGALPAGDAETLAMGWWSLAHGLASLLLDGQLAKRATMIGTDADTLSHRVMTLFAAALDAPPA
jgi:AcrR family transcriptional regulator